MKENLVSYRNLKAQYWLDCSVPGCDKLTAGESMLRNCIKRSENAKMQNANGQNANQQNENRKNANG